MPVQTITGDIDKIVTTIKGAPKDKVVLKIYGTYCGPCKRIAPTFEAQANDPTNSGIAFYEMDVEQDEEASQILGAETIPYFITFVQQGKILEKFQSSSEDALKEQIAKLRDYGDKKEERVASPQQAPEAAPVQTETIPPEKRHAAEGAVLSITGDIDAIVAKIKGAPKDKVVLKIYGTYCGPCKRIAPTFEAQANDPTNSGIAFYEMDVEQDEEASQILGAETIPYFITFVQQGKILEKFQSSSEDALKEQIAKLREWEPKK
jgi:thioredoxin 1